MHALLKRECFDCHGDESPEGGLSLTQLINQEFGETQRQTWWKVLSNVRAETMPPPDHGSEITAAERAEVAKWIKFDVFQINPADPDPGKVTIRRLNRTEYANTIRDLMGIDFNADVVFPPDDTGFGFDNIGDALSLSPMLVEKYLLQQQRLSTERYPKFAVKFPRYIFLDGTSKTIQVGISKQIARANTLQKSNDLVITSSESSCEHTALSNSHHSAAI